MDSGTKVISQKEYLKKYLSKPNPEKKKKKSEKISSSTFLKRSVIVDDDVPLREIPVPEEEIINLDYLGDEAPQIAGFVDERPLDMIWKPIDQKEEDKEEVVNIFERTKQSKSKKKVKDDLPLSESNFQGETKHSNKKDEKSKRRSQDSDFSPERRKPKVDSDGDLSPPRKSRKNGRYESGTSKNYDSDLSPPRSRKENYEKSKHYSKKRYDSDYSHHKRSERREPSPKRRRKGSDSDNSPPRKSDKSRERKNYDSDSSPPRKYSKDSRHESTHRRHDKYSSESKHKSKYDKNHSRGDYLEKTLDGKKSGLQSAKNLKDELRELKDKEDRAFKEMDPTVLGQSASTIVRDRKTGLKRDFAKEKEAIKERNAKEAARKEKYDKWGRGLKQVQEQEGKVADALHEMSKPLARYKDDEDLDKYLRDRQRDGDPMLEYIRKQQAEAHTVIDLTEPESGRKRYQGNYNANRFGIPPGYRWDGVDRSNGYEIKWFEHKNARKAGEEEVYKWSVADM